MPRAEAAWWTEMPKKRKKPKKPTERYGVISFPKDGRVKENIHELSPEKTAQEHEVTDSFVKGFNKHSKHRTIQDWKALPEQDQDFLLDVDGDYILLQVTELVDRDFVTPMTNEEFVSGHWTSSIQKRFRETPARVDMDAMEEALTVSIAKKLEKHYARESGKGLWLLVFTTVSNYHIEYVSQGKRHTSPAMDRARDLLASTSDLVFDEVWFTNLVTKPVKVWPA